ncbi:MAG: twin-arginine translocase TatA/TatE family subunit [Leptospiraceae bacterium]|jgi:sec-independent protein translocase protein TatA|nr:twin-arginine translocase TatA/TatE family subunit [Leptospiraceae bacterium]MCZ8346845.1 twin-arginine translocase TatA/TatE family subunit [Leptospiraceae bacterium]PJE04508.1 MAG: twin-arginine translocase TatA/TatE family subunit [Leptospira sp.]
MNSFLLPPLGFLNLGPWEIALILFLALLLFGGKKLPGLAKDLGEGIREFRRSLSTQVDEDRKEIASTPAKEEVASQSKSSKPKAKSETSKKKKV